MVMHSRRDHYRDREPRRVNWPLLAGLLFCVAVWGAFAFAVAFFVDFIRLHVWAL